jgi:glycine cleavage system H protein
MSKTKYSSDHEYIKIEGEVAIIGISEHAQEQLGDIVFVELPNVGTEFSKGDEVAVIESVKAASELYVPIIEVNEALNDEPALVNSDAQGKGWIFKMFVANAQEFEELMDETAYQTHIS